MMVGLLIAGIWGCGGDEPQPAGDLADIPYVPQAYLLPELPYFFPDLSVPADNPLTVDGVELGRYLFYDPILSVDSTLSCAGCHRQELGFTDGLALSEGVGQTIGIRNAKPLANVGFFEKGLFWDGRVQTLEELALHPIEDPLEMKNTLENLIADLQVHPEYPAMFRKAFGIADREEISAPLIAKALGQFTRTLVSFNAKYDYANWDRGPETQFFSLGAARTEVVQPRTDRSRRTPSRMLTLPCRPPGQHQRVCEQRPGRGPRARRLSRSGPWRDHGQAF